MDERIQYHNGHEVTGAPLQVDAFGPLALWGEGCFDTFRVHSSRILCCSEHQDRLRNSCRALWGSRDALVEKVEAAWRFLQDRAGSFSNARGRVLVAPSDALRREFDVFAELAPYTPVSSSAYVHGTRVGFSTHDHPGYGRWGKVTSVLWSRMAAEEARTRGFDEMILCRDAIVVEGTWAALMWREKDAWKTPASSLNPLPSTTLAALRATGLAIDEVVATRERLSYASAIVLLSALRLAMGVERLEDREFSSPDRAAKPLRELLLRA